MNLYRQCQLEKGSYSQTAFLPEKFCKVGQKVRLRLGGIWEDGWKVVSSDSLAFEEGSLPDIRSSSRKKP